MCDVGVNDPMGDAKSAGSAEHKSSGITSEIKGEQLIKGEDEQEDEDDEDDDCEVDDNAMGTSDKKKKKKKKGKKKKKAAIVGTKLPLSRCLLGFTDSYLKYGQSDPPTRLVSELFPTGFYPIQFNRPLLPYLLISLPTRNQIPFIFFSAT